MFSVLFSYLVTLKSISVGADHTCNMQISSAFAVFEQCGATYHDMFLKKKLTYSSQLSFRESAKHCERCLDEMFQDCIYVMHIIKTHLVTVWYFKPGTFHVLFDTDRKRQINCCQVQLENALVLQTVTSSRAGGPKEENLLIYLLTKQNSGVPTKQSKTELN